MAQSPTERVTALEQTVAGHTIRLDALVKDVDALSAKHSDAGRELTTLHRDFEREVALLKQRSRT